MPGNCQHPVSSVVGHSDEPCALARVCGRFCVVHVWGSTFGVGCVTHLLFPLSMFPVGTIARVSVAFPTGSSVSRCSQPAGRAVAVVYRWYEMGGVPQRGHLLAIPLDQPILKVPETMFLTSSSAVDSAAQRRRAIPHTVTSAPSRSHPPQLSRRAAGASRPPSPSRRKSAREVAAVRAFGAGYAGPRPRSGRWPQRHCLDRTAPRPPRDPTSGDQPLHPAGSVAVDV